ncbi:hypothetical protein Tco_0121548 [Tanacetum coccineum]
MKCSLFSCPCSLTGFPTKVLLCGEGRLAMRKEMSTLDNIYEDTTEISEPVRPGKNKRKKGRKLDSGNQVGQRFRESFQEERAAIRGIVPKEKEEEQRFRELFPKEGRPIDSGNQSREN